jgi:hypothetical protein
MFEGWENFYLIVGPSAGALIGLMFVVVTLNTGRNTDQRERGKHFYTSPIVWHLAVVLSLSGGAVAPSIREDRYGWVMLGLAIAGFAMACRSTYGIWSQRFTGSDTLFDTCWYGIVPGVVYFGLGVAGTGAISGAPWAADAVGLALMALLLVSVHAEWDLVTYLAPRANNDGGDNKKK